MDPVEALYAEIDLLTQEASQWQHIATSESAHAHTLGMELDFAQSELQKYKIQNEKLWNWTK